MLNSMLSAVSIFLRDTQRTCYYCGSVSAGSGRCVYDKKNIVVKHRKPLLALYALEVELLNGVFIFRQYKKRSHRLNKRKRTQIRAQTAKQSGQTGTNNERNDNTTTPASPNRTEYTVYVICFIHNIDLRW